MAESSTSIDRRRELRRRKILENSEDRLRKLSSCQRTSCTDQINVQLGDQGPDIPNSSPSNKNELLSSHSNVLSEDSHNSGKESARQALHYILSQNLKCEFSGDGNIESKSPLRPQRFTKDIQTLPKILTEHRTYSKAKIESHSPGQSTLKSGDFILRRKQWCVTLAIVGRLLLCLFSRTALSKCIVIFFLMMEAIIFGTEILSDVEHRQHLHGTVATLLLMYGVKNASTIVWIYECCVKFMEDLLVFLFVFFFCHWWIG